MEFVKVYKPRSGESIVENEFILCNRPRNDDKKSENHLSDGMAIKVTVVSFQEFEPHRHIGHIEMEFVKVYKPHSGESIVENEFILCNRPRNDDKKSENHPSDGMAINAF